MGTEKTCAQRWKDHYDSRIEEIRTLWNLYKEDSEAYDDDLGNWIEYGLWFDYVSPGTFTDQDQGYFRYQISWGGPSEEFRFYVNPDLSCYKIEFWFLDWYDGEGESIYGDDKNLMMEIYEGLKGCGTIQHLIDESRDN
ncbi:MAG: hypothetical protein KJ556_20240 [Gammaproteobacteria bacterium]|nr:hypothetical protein [Gammaproteobacteria bacterium]